MAGKGRNLASVDKTGRSRPSIHPRRKLIVRPLDALHWFDLSCGIRELKLEIDEPERRTLRRALAEWRTHLIETVGDTTRTVNARRFGSRELELIETVLRKLRFFDRTSR